jgi:DNA-binding transcriptional LysR family regulator
VTPEDWDDLRYVLAVAEAGTVSEAARRIGVNHATVLRRIAAFEGRQGAPVFDKTRSGYVVPPDRLRVIEALREVQAAVLGVDRLMKGNVAPLIGVVRVTSTDSLCQCILPPMLAQIQQNAPELRCDLISTNAHVELGRLQADITVRPAVILPDDLFGIPAGKIGFGLYAPTTAPMTDRWLAISGASARSVAAAWMEANIDPSCIVGAADSFLILREMVASGQGAAVLPCYIGDGDPRLIRRNGILPQMQVPIWVASHLDLADTPRIRTVRDLLARGLLAQAARLTGNAGAA